MFEILKRLNDAGKTTFLVGPNVQMALAVSDYSYVLADGKMKLKGPS